MVDVNARRHLCTLVAAAFIDGKFDTKEKSVVYRKAREMSIPLTMIDEIIDLGRAGKLSISIPPTSQGKEALLNDLVDVVCADGRLEPQENHLIQKFGATLGMGPQEIAERVRRQLGQGPPPVRVQETAVVIVETETHKPSAPSFAPIRQESRTSIEDAKKIAAPQRDAIGRPTITKELPPGPIHPPGPIKLSGPILGAISGDLPLITLGIVKQILLFNGKDEAIDYLQRSLRLERREEAARMIDNVLRDNPDVKPGAQRARVK